MRQHVITLRVRGLCVAIVAMLVVAACDQQQSGAPKADATPPAASAQSAPESLPMGGAKSVLSFFVTSRGIGKGGDLGGLAGADAHCQALAAAEHAGDHTWRAYLSVAATANEPAMNARDRIGKGPWYNAEGNRIAANLDELHGPDNKIGKESAVTERLDPVNGVGDSPNVHDILTGSRPDGTAFDGRENLTCGNWRSGDEGLARVGHHDRVGQGAGAGSWNSAHASRGCSQDALRSTGGAGLFYCFAID